MNDESGGEKTTGVMEQMERAVVALLVVQAAICLWWGSLPPRCCRSAASPSQIVGVSIGMESGLQQIKSGGNYAGGGR